MLQGQEAGNLYLLSLPDSYPLNPHLHRGWSHVVAPGAVNSPDSMLLARTHHRACTPPADHARKRVRARKEPTEREKVRWGFAKIPFALCHVGSLAPRPCALLRWWDFCIFPRGWALRSLWRKCYYQTQIYQGSCFVAISLAHILRQGLFWSDFFFPENTSGFVDVRFVSTGIQPHMLYRCKDYIVIRYFLRMPLRPLAPPCVFDTSRSPSQNLMPPEDVSKSTRSFINPQIDR